MRDAPHLPPVPFGCKADHLLTSNKKSIQHCNTSDMACTLDFGWQGWQTW